MIYHVSRGQLHSLISSHHVKEEILNAKLRSLACFDKVFHDCQNESKQTLSNNLVISGNRKLSTTLVKLMLTIVIFLAEIHSLKLNSQF